MNNARTTVAKNATILMGAQIVTGIISLAMTIVLPRHLGPENIGLLAIAGAIWAIPSVFISFGTDTLLVKEIARAPERAADLFGHALVLRMVLYLVSWLGIILYISTAQVSSILVPLILIAGVGQLIFIGTGVGTAAIQGLELMAYGSIADIIGKGINLALMIIAVFLGYGVVAIALIGIIPALISFAIQHYFLRQRVHIRLHFDRRAILAMAKQGRPYLLSGLAVTAYANIDSLIISALIDERSVGYYSMAQRLVGTFLFIPSIFITAAFPALARAHTNDPSVLPKLARKSFEMLLLLAVPLGLGIIVISDPLVLLLYGSEFAPSGPVLAVQGITLIFLYLTILLGQLLTSTDRQNTWTIIMIVATVVTVILDFALIPWCQRTFGNGAIGGVLSFVITECAMVVLGIVLLPKGTLGLPTVYTAVRIVFAGLVMLVVAWQFRDLFIAIPIAVGAIVYSMLILLMRVVPNEDFALLKGLALQAVGRIRNRAVLAKS